MAWMCWHKWSKWIVVGDINMETRKVGEIQQRHCEKCGFTQMNKIW